MADINRNYSLVFESQSKVDFMLFSLVLISPISIGPKINEACCNIKNF